MKGTPISQTILNLASAYGVTVARSESCDRNHGACAGMDIMLGEFDDSEIELVAFFHELGHTRIQRGYTMSTLSCEGAAWERGLDLAYENGYAWGYHSKPMKWARLQFNSYLLNSDWSRELIAG